MGNRDHRSASGLSVDLAGALEPRESRDGTATVGRLHCHYISGMLYPASWAGFVPVVVFALVVVSWVLYVRTRSGGLADQRR